MAPKRSPPLAGALWSVVLAAGGSTRLGRPKQLVRYRNRPLLGRAAALAERATPGRVLVVIGADAGRIRYALRRHSPRVRVVRNARWREGMAGSLAQGLGRLPREARAALILLVDQPGVTEHSIARLVDRWRRRPSRPAAAGYADRIGAPAILPRRLWKAARSLRGDVGARALLRGAAGPVTVKMPEAAADVDTADDVAALLGTRPSPGR